MDYIYIHIHIYIYIFIYVIVIAAGMAQMVNRKVHASATHTPRNCMRFTHTHTHTNTFVCRMQNILSSGLLAILSGLWSNGHHATRQLERWATPLCSRRHNSVAYQHTRI